MITKCRWSTKNDQGATTSLEVIFVVAGALGSRAIDYLLGTPDDRQVPPVVANEWPSDRRLFDFTQ